MTLRRKIVFGLFLLLAWLFVLALGWYAISRWMERSKVQALTVQVQQAKESGEQELTLAFEDLRAQNPEFSAWLTIEGTRVDYPVMHTPDEPEKYLRKDFFGAYSMMGLPFLYAGCQWQQSANLIVYGHNMQSGDMFADLMQYLDGEFALRHPWVVIDTPQEQRTYRLMAVVPFELTVENEHIYYQCADASNEAAFAEYVEFLNRNSVVDTGVTAEWGQQLLTLSTCSDYTAGPGRLLVVARLEHAKPHREN